MLPQEKVNGIMAFVDSQIVAINGLEVTDANSMAEAAERGVKVKNAIKKLEDMRKEVVGPLNDQVKEVNNKFKFFTEPLEKAKDTLNAKMVAFQRAEMARVQAERERAERARQEELEKIRKEKEEAEAALEAKKKIINDERLSAEKESELKQMIEDEEKEMLEMAELERQQTLVPTVIEPVQKTVRTLSGAKATFKERWTYEVVTLNEVPNEYLMADNTAIKKAISMGVRDIPGLRIYTEINVSR